MCITFHCTFALSNSTKQFKTSNKMKTNQFTTFKSSELAIAKALEFIQKNYVTKNPNNISELDKIHDELKMMLIYVADASALDVRNATGNFLREFNNTLKNELIQKFETK